MEPTLIESQIRYRSGRKGFPKRVSASLYPDRLVIRPRSGGEEIITVNDMARAAFANNVVAIGLRDGTTRSLFMESLTQRVLYRGLFGVIGSILVQNRSSGRTRSEAWLTQLSSLGLEVRRPKGFRV